MKRDWTRDDNGAWTLGDFTITKLDGEYILTVAGENHSSFARLKEAKSAAKTIRSVTYPNPLETLEAEIAEGAELLRPHYPDADEDELRERALSMLRVRYRDGRWPTAEEVKKAEDAVKNADLGGPLWPEKLS